MVAPRGVVAACGTTTAAAAAAATAHQHPSSKRAACTYSYTRDGHVEADSPTARQTAAALVFLCLF